MGTHGRSIYKTDISILQKLNDEVLNTGLVVFDLPETKYSENWGNPTTTWTKPNTPGLDIIFYSAKEGPYMAEIRTAEGVSVSQTTLEAEKGLNILSYDLAFSKKGKADYLKKYKRKLVTAKDGKTYLPAGNYEVTISGTGLEEKVRFIISD